LARNAAAVISAGVLAAGCSIGSARLTDEKVTTYSPRVVSYGEPVPRGGGSYKLGKPYSINGRIYTPEDDPGYARTGIASWYGQDFHGRQTANGEVYDMHALTAAHPTLPLPSFVRVTSLETNRSLVLRVNDRGPFKRGRIIDLSYRAAQELGIARQGTGRVHVRYLGRAPL